MKKYIPILLFFALVSAGLGVAAGHPSVLASVAASLFLFVAMTVFFVVLPKYMGRPMEIFIAMLSGIACGWAFQEFQGGDHVSFVTDYVAIFGTLFILLLKMVIVPLVFISIVCGVASIGDVRKLGSIGAKTLTYYFVTTAIAVVIGLMVVNTIRPGVGMEKIDTRQAAVDTARMSPGMLIQKEVLPEYIRNPLGDKTLILAVIVGAVLFGAALAANGEKSGPALKIFKSLDAAMVTLVLGIMCTAPIGVFALMAKAVVTLGVEYILQLAKYCGTVLLGLGIHFAVLSCVICPLLGRMSPMRFLRGIAPALELAFSSSSSSATLPVTIDCVTRELGVNRSVSSFMLPIGATINMDGTALYQAVASIFIAQVYGVHLGASQQLMVFITAVIVSIGTAGIPGASLGMMAIVLGSAGIPVEGIGIVIGVDRFLDMTRTLVNVTGDSVGCVVVAQSEGEDIPVQDGMAGYMDSPDTTQE